MQKILQKETISVGTSASLISATWLFILIQKILSFMKEKFAYYTLDGLNVLKNPLTDRLLVSKITTFMNNTIYVHKGPYTTGFGPREIRESNFFDQKAGFFTINSKEILEKFPYSADDRRTKWSQEENFPAFEKMYASHLEDFEEKLLKDPDKIQDGLYKITDLLFPYKEQSK